MVVVSIKKQRVKSCINSSWIKDVLLKSKCLRNSMNIIESKNYRIGIYEINKIFLFYFDDKIHILNNGYDGLVPGYSNWL